MPKIILFFPKNPHDFYQKKFYFCQKIRLIFPQNNFIFPKKSVWFLPEIILFLPKNPPDFSQKEFDFCQKIRVIFAKKSCLIFIFSKMFLFFPKCFISKPYLTVVPYRRPQAGQGNSVCVWLLVSVTRPWFFCRLIMLINNGSRRLLFKAICRCFVWEWWDLPYLLQL